MPDPNRHTAIVQLRGTPPRHYYSGHDLSRAVAIEDLRAMTHRRLPDFVLEYLEGGAEDEATLRRERRAYAGWRFVPRQLVDVSHRSLATTILGRPAPMPLIVAPTGLNGLFRHHADTLLARGAAKAGVPFVQSTMSNDPVEEVAKAGPGLRHWWQLYVFGGDEVWQELIARADRAGCEALVLTTNAQIFGDREWSQRTRANKSRPTVPTALDAAAHFPWFATTLATHGMPTFANVIDFIPKNKRGFFESALWIRQHQPTSLSWDTVAKIRQRWKKPMLLKGLLHPDDVRRAVDAGVEGVVLSSHGGRQMDWTVSALDVVAEARKIAGDRLELHVSGGVRRGTDVLKAAGLGADAVMAGRAVLYGLCAAGARGVERALDILQREADQALGLMGATSLGDLRKPGLLARAAPAV
ncbi:MAG TPA: alpha-hydroxy acid oxidase [Caulobacteraceae bacterium]|jgi:(S)-mandelate dehydrogenase|nr:alpha-hydroxy acid oxidase [Caulobacteraceae bacterium]